jgi:cyclopropane fatty-acyl-phospholipid synthase-like methyltransferase
MLLMMNIFQKHLDNTRGISKHCMLRNILIISGIFLMSSKIITPRIFIASIVIFELFLDILNHNGISLDPYENKIINFYRWADTLWSSEEVKKINTYTEGKYDCNPHASLENGNVEKFKWMAEQAQVTKGTRLLELGSGNGEFLKFVKENYEAEPIGLCNSKPQVELNAANGIEVVLADIWDIPESLHGKFDCVVLNGSTEHFCSWKDRHDIDKKLEQLFIEINKCLDPASTNNRIVITAITQHRDFSIYEKMQIYLLERSYGGYYATTPDSYEKNAEKQNFRLVLRENHTDDYYIWARRIWWHVFSGLSEPETLIRTLIDIPVFLLNDPYYIHKILHLIFGSWPWQFESPYIPLLSMDDTPPFQHQWIVIEKNT